MQLGAAFAARESSVMEFWRNQHRLEYDLHRNRRRSAQRFGDFLRILSDLFERLRPIKVLAACDEPYFELFHGLHDDTRS